MCSDIKDPMWQQVRTFLKNLGTLVPGLDKYSARMLQILDAWLEESFAGNLLHVKNCGSAHPQVTGQLVELLMYDYDSTSPPNWGKLSKYHGMGYTPRKDLQTGECYAEISGIFGFKVEDEVAIPNWTYQQYLLNTTQKEMKDHVRNNNNRPQANDRNIHSKSQHFSFQSQHF